MRSAIVGLVAGICWLQTMARLPQAGLPAPAAVLLLLLALVLLALLPARRRLQTFRVATLFACGVGVGFFWAGLLAQQRLAQELPLALEGQDLTLIGVVDNLPLRFERGVRFNFLVERVASTAASASASSSPSTLNLPSRLALSWYDDPGSSVGPVPEIEPGARWQLQVRLKRPHGNANPYGFDYEAWLLEQNLRATGSVRQQRGGGLVPTDAPAMNRRLDAFVPGVANQIERWRANLRSRILSALPDRPYAAVLVALVVGDQRGISQSDWKVFNATGIGHLISISGLHITMIAGLMAALVMALWRRSFFTGLELPLLLPAQKAAALAGALTALLYVALSGFGVPAQRTLYMLSVVALAMWTGRLTSVSHVLCLALAAVVLIDPWAVLWPGFWLSFGAVGMILYASTGKLHALQAPSGWRSGLGNALHTQYVVTLGLVPLSLLLFSQVSLVGPIANAIAIPLISFIVTPLSLIGSVLPAPLAGWILLAAHHCVAALAAFLGWLSSMPAAVWLAPMPSPWMFALALVGTLWVIAPAGWPLRASGALLWLPLLLNQPTQPAAGFWMTAFDIGQGTAVLIETRHHRLLYDTGPSYTPEADGGNRVILPYLRSRGITALDTLVVSHQDNDHAGGALSLMGGLHFDRVSTSMDDSNAIVRTAVNHHRCLAGQAWDWDGVHFEMLHPTEAIYQRKTPPNARSCTLKVSYGARSALLPGDIESAQEADLVRRYAAHLGSTVLLAPHHGSGTSSTMPFLQAVNPVTAIFQVGYRNRYRHPKPEVFERYAGRGIERLRTDDSGAVVLQVAETITQQQYRQEHARYWYGK